MNLANPGELKTFLTRHGLTAFKGLGQHFLVSSSVVEKILGACEGCAGILEIGPGPGVLTSPLSNRFERVIALELDPQMIEALKESAPRADVRRQDVMKADFSGLLAELPEPKAVVSNMPYYITGPLLQRVAQHFGEIDRAVLMMQKEVARRVAAKPRDSERGSLSVYLQSIFEISTVAQASAGLFLPPPKVDSTVLSLKPRVTAAGLTPAFFKTVRLGFAQPRKTLANNLAAGFRIERDMALAAIEHAGLGKLSRPQELTETEWIALAESLSNSSVAPTE